MTTVHFNPEILKKLRIKKGLTRAELEAKSGVDRDTIYAWESGRRLPSAQRLARVAKVLGVRLDDFFVLDSDICPHDVCSGKDG